jgi:hypothetical protein
MNNMSTFLNDFAGVAVPFLLAIIVYFAKKQDSKLERLLTEFSNMKIEFSVMQSEKKNTEKTCSIHSEKINHFEEKLSNHEIRINVIENESRN